MEFDEIVVKESPGLCRCCLSEGCYKDLGSEYTWMSDTEVYADMLLDCFDISITQHNEGPNGPNRLICEVCITRLRDACNFKKQVLDSEKKFIDMVGRGEFKPKLLIYQAQMKSEQNHETSVEVGDAEYLEDIDFGDDDVIKDESAVEPTVSDVTVTTLPIKGKRGRPRKAATPLKPEKKAKVARLEEKPRSSKAVTKGATSTVPSISTISSTKRNRQIKSNAINIIESSTAMPFKWHRQNYLCFYCCLPFKNINTLKDHTNVEHLKPNIKTAVGILRRDEKVKIDITDLNCRHCDSNIEDLESLVDHLKSSHNKIFNEDYNMGVVPYVIKNDLYYCAVCKKVFQYFIKLNQHMNDHFGSYVCELCGKTFLSQERLRFHTLAHTSGFRCAHCPETFTSINLRNNHIHRAHDIKKLHKCLYCNETFENYNLRNTHHSTAHSISLPEFVCPVCGKKFRIMSKMRIHLKEVHERERNMSCTMCDLKFFSKTHVRKHMVKHLGARIHVCEVCKKAYPRKQSLRDHLKIHDKDKKYVCAVCSAAFVQNRSFKLHMKTHRSESLII